MNKFVVLVAGLSFSLPICAAKIDPNAVFRQLNEPSIWQSALHDPGTLDWKKHWFVDGKEVTVTNSNNGMTFTTGDEEMDPAHHGVLWTKRSFSGDIKIEYDYTRLDSEHKGAWVYIVAIKYLSCGRSLCTLV